MMILWFGGFVFLLCAVCVVAFVARQNNVLSNFKNFAKNQFQNCTLEDFKDRATSLDLILTCTPSFHQKIIHRFTGSEWTHVGLVYRNVTNNKLFIIEVSDNKGFTKLDNVKRDGLCQTEFDHWLKMHKKFGDEKMLWIPRNNSFNASTRNPQQELDYKIQFNQLIESNKHINLAMDLRFIQATLKKQFNHEFDNVLPQKVTCAHWTAFVLQQLGLLKKQYGPAFFSPTDLIVTQDYEHQDYSIPFEFQV